MKGIHLSDMRTFRSCRRLWNYTSPLRKNLEPNAEKHYLWTGKAIHYALSVYYAGKNSNPEDLMNGFDSFLETNPPNLADGADENEQICLASGVLNHYGMWSPSHNDFEIIMPEVNIAVPLGDDTYYTGQSDCLVKKKEGNYWLLEHKTCSRFPDYDLLVMDDQAAAYVWGCTMDPRFEGMIPKGVIFNFLRKKIPYRPELTSRGKLSQRANMDTSYEIYLNAIEENGEDPKDYTEFLLMLRQKKNEDFFRRMPILVNQQRLKSFEQDFLGCMKDMLNDPRIYPTSEWYGFSKCYSCPFKMPCKMESSGSNPQGLLETDFHLREEAYTFFGEDNL